MEAKQDNKLREGYPSQNPVDHGIAAASQHLLSQQNSRGAWTERFDTGLMADAQTLISLALLHVIDKAWTKPLLDRVLTQQRADGSWGVHPEQAGNLSTTIECFYALTLYDSWSSADAKLRASDFIIDRGGVRRARNLTKVFLAVGGEIPWSWLPSPRLYTWLFSTISPVSIHDVVTFTRLHVASMLLLSSTHYVAADPQLRALQFLVDYPRISDRSRTRHRSRVSHVRQRHLSRCLDWLLNQRESDGTLAGYHSSTFLALFAFRALSVSKSVAREDVALDSVRRNVHVDQVLNDTHQQTCNGHIWNTALAVHALVSSGGDIGTAEVKRAVRYLVSKQHRPQSKFSLTSLGGGGGGWGFSDNNARHPDNDDTVACLEALHPYRDQLAANWERGVEYLLRMQNKDGGWSAFNKDCSKRWLEWIPANDMKRTMIDPSTPDITGRVLSFLIRREVMSPQDVRVVRAAHWLCRRQQRDGSWYGRWGTTYIYGTWCAVKALVLIPSQGALQARCRALEWLLSLQHPDGSFGESSSSEVKGRFVRLSHGTPTHTAWALDALLDLYEGQPHRAADRVRLFDAANRAVAWLLRSSNSDGTWSEAFPTGSAFAGDLYIRYHIYPQVWPLVALSHYRRVLA